MSGPRSVGRIDSRTTRCRSCGASIMWARTTAGKRIPLDVGRHDDGNVEIDPIGTVYTTEARPALRTHFQTCPDAKGWRQQQPPLWGEAES